MRFRRSAAQGAPVVTRRSLVRVYFVAGAILDTGAAGELLLNPAGTAPLPAHFAAGVAER